MAEVPQLVKSHYQFAWDSLGDIKEGRGDLGEDMPVLVYRLMQYTMLDVLSREFGAERANQFFRDAGYIAGVEFSKNSLNLNVDFNSFLANLQQSLQELKIGILRVESYQETDGKIVMTVGQDLDCSGLPVTNENVCNYDEGFISGILESYTGKPYEVTEIDCWANGDRVCRFEGVIKSRKKKSQFKSINPNSVANLLFSYLRDVFYRQNYARLDFSKVPSDFEQLARGLEYFVYCVSEVRSFAKAIAKGDLHSSIPAADNELAAPLKALHATLKHLTWQTQQVANGDYSQHVDYLGDFADGFNTMIKQLDERYKALNEEIERSTQKTLQLAESNDLFEIVTKENSQWMVVVDKANGEWLFNNYPVTNILLVEEFLPQLTDWLNSRLKIPETENDISKVNHELELSYGGFTQFF
ncbi:MAG: hypothetical protein LBQ68_06785, partial [Clostridiales bacterium]|nr:hypothetical protein [Clostridiales bacterium]